MTEGQNLYLSKLGSRILIQTCCSSTCYMSESALTEATSKEWCGGWKFPSYALCLTLSCSRSSCLLTLPSVNSCPLQPLCPWEKCPQCQQLTYPCLRQEAGYALLPSSSPQRRTTNWNHYLHFYYFSSSSYYSQDPGENKDVRVTCNLVNRNYISFFLISWSVKNTRYCRFGCF